MAEQGVIVEIQLCIQRQESTLGGDDQGIDRDQRTVFLLKYSIQRRQEVGSRSLDRQRQRQIRYQSAKVKGLKLNSGIDGDPGNSLRTCRCDLLDLHPPDRTDYDDRPGRPMIQNYPDVQLATDGQL